MAFEWFGKEHIALTKVIERYFGADACYLDISCLDVARVILEAGWTKQEWISAKDRLPEADGDYLVWNDYHKAIVGHYWSKGRYFISKAVAVTHWMPLPDSPKEEK